MREHGVRRLGDSRRRGAAALARAGSLQLLEDVLRGFDELGALLDQAWQPLASGEWIEPGIANTSLPCSFASRAVMSEPLDSAASTTRQPRASPLMRRLRRGKFAATGGVPSAKLRNDAAVARELVRELAIARRINDVEPGADDGDAARRAGEPAAVRRRVDAEREPAHDREPRVRQRARESFGVRDALLGRVAAADDRERRRVEELDAAFRVQERRRIGGVQQRLGIVGDRRA